MEVILSARTPPPATCWSRRLAAAQTWPYKVLRRCSAHGQVYRAEAPNERSWRGNCSPRRTAFCGAVSGMSARSWRPRTCNGARLFAPAPPPTRNRTSSGSVSSLPSTVTATAAPEWGALDLSPRQRRVHHATPRHRAPRHQAGNISSPRRLPKLRISIAKILNPDRTTQSMDPTAPLVRMMTRSTQPRAGARRRWERRHRILLARRACTNCSPTPPIASRAARRTTGGYHLRLEPDRPTPR